MTNTKSEVLNLIREVPRTITELSATLKLTRNAIVVQIAALEAEGLIQQAGNQLSGKKGKPAVFYEAVGGREDHHSGAYRDFSRLLLSAIRKTETEEKLQALLRDVGVAMADELRRSQANASTVTFKQARAFLDGLGANTAETEVSQTESLMISNSCPIAGLVRETGLACSTVEHFLKAVCTDVKDVEVECSHQQKLRCQFRVHLLIAESDEIN